MVENFYAMLAKTGFNHPLHPMLTHVPMGMIIGMVVFAFLGLIWKSCNFDRTAFHCSILALAAVLPVIAMYAAPTPGEPVAPKSATATHLSAGARPSKKNSMRRNL